MALTAINLLSVTACTPVLSWDGVEQIAQANQPAQQIAGSSTHTPPPREIYLDDNCQPTERREMTWRVTEQFAFTAGGKSYLLSPAHYEDGSVQLCWSGANFQHAKLVAAREFHGAYINRVVKVGKALFQVTIQEGNDCNVPISHYQLDLSQPDAPKVKRISLKSSISFIAQTSNAEESRLDHHIGNSILRQMETRWSDGSSLFNKSLTIETIALNEGPILAFTTHLDRATESR